MTIEQGAAVAWAVGEFHEIVGSLTGDNTPLQGAMDRHNNQEGIDSARERRPIDPNKLIHFPGGKPGQRVPNKESKKPCP